MNNRTQVWWRKALDDFMRNETNGCDMDGVWIVRKLLQSKLFSARCLKFETPGTKGLI